MNILNAPQGSQEWLAARATRFTASEAPAMMGASKYQTRADLLRQKATGITPEVDESTQRLFDRGHAAEAAARPIVEEIIGDDLSPMTGALEVDGLPLLASFDGVTQGRDIVWESKLWNESLAEQVRAFDLEPHYYWQLEQQLLVSGAERAYFTTSDGTPENTVGMWYESQPERRAALIAGWKQFKADLVEYVHVEAAPKPVAAPQMALPAVSVQVQGNIAIIDNLGAFGEALESYVERINRKPETDDDFATLEATVKTLKTAEEALDAAENNALGQAASIDAMRRTVALYRAMARDTRLAIDKLVKAEKDNRRAAIVTQAAQELQAHVCKLNERIGGNLLPATLYTAARFAESIKGLKSLDSMRDKVSAAVANAKIEASAMADRIEANKKAMGEHAHLFNDFSIMCTKDTADFANLVQIRIESENRRVTAERERIRQEEAAKLEAERANAARQALALDGAAGASARNDQRGNAEEATHAQPQATAAPQAPAASTPPIASAVCEQHTNNTMIDDFIRLLPISPVEKAGIRGYITKWETYRRKMEAARGMGIAA